MKRFVNIILLALVIAGCGKTVFVEVPKPQRLEVPEVYKTPLAIPRAIPAEGMTTLEEVVRMLGEERIKNCKLYKQYCGLLRQQTLGQGKQCVFPTEDQCPKK